LFNPRFSRRLLPGCERSKYLSGGRQIFFVQAGDKPFYIRFLNKIDRANPKSAPGDACAQATRIFMASSTSSIVSLQLTS
jgi:hypothetical protein